MKKLILLLLSVVFVMGCKNDSDKKVVEKDNGKAAIQDSETDNNPQNQFTANQTTSALQKNEDETYSFRYNLKKGETYPFVLKTNTEQSLDNMGKKLNIQSSRTVVFDYFVEEVKNNQFYIKATFKKFAESAKSPNGTISYDTNSPKPTDKEVAQSWSVYKSITGESFEMVMNNRGKVVSVNGLEKVVSSAMKKLSGDFNPDEQKEIKQLLDYSLSKESIISQFEESLNIFPEKNIKVGEKWEDSQNINDGPVKGNNKVTRTFKEIKDGRATIVVSGIQDVSGTDKDEKSGVTANMKNHASIEGSVDLDFETGWIKKARITKSEKITTTYSKDNQKETEENSQTIITTVN